MSKIAVVTGANQGLGFALAERLSRRLAPADRVYLTGRDPDRVRAAAARIAGPRAPVSGGSSTSATAPPPPRSPTRSPPATATSTSCSQRRRPAHSGEALRRADRAVRRVATEASRPWFDDMSEAQTPAQAAVSPLRLALEAATDPRASGELIQLGRVMPWC
jgi:NAD(P)-dependent dehydrogenase (short-subunit alcohol dehydrogenase family)